MAVLKLSLDDLFEDEVFTLIAIHCDLEQYRIAYLLNKHLKIVLKREHIDVIDIKKNTNYALFEYLDINTDITYNLVENQCKISSEKPNISANLFSEEKNNNKTTYHLIPEQKKVAYFLKINTKLTSIKTQVILNKILEIPQVITAYYLNAENLKSKNNLIFH